MALLDTDHDAHDRVHEWFGQHAHNGWATCAATENGLVRVVRRSRYRNPVPSADAVALLTFACRSEGHHFCVRHVATTGATTLLGPSQIIDVYLLALVVARGGRFATLHRTVAHMALVDATEDSCRPVERGGPPQQLSHV